jgi:soluble lytic murein transglycosylase
VRKRKAKRAGKRRAKRAGSRTAGRRLALGAGVVALGVLAAFGVAKLFDVGEVIQELTLPLRHEDVIRQQADEKEVDAALIAAVIYSESKFSDQTSSAGARGLMQITPETAQEVKRHSHGTDFTLKDLSDPEINIRYGTYVLRELLQRFDGDEVAALAAYNAGPANAEKWGGSDLSVGEIPFPETRAYVEEVLDKRQAYRDKYGKELGY